MTGTINILLRCLTTPITTSYRDSETDQPAKHGERFTFQTGHYTAHYENLRWRCDCSCEFSPADACLKGTTYFASTSRRRQAAILAVAYHWLSPKRQTQSPICGQNNKDFRC